MLHYCIIVLLALHLGNDANMLALAKKFNSRHDVVFEMYHENGLAARLTLNQINRDSGRSNGFANEFHFDKNRPTRIFVHGFYSERETLEKYAAAYSEAGDFNFIAVNWLRGAVTINYAKARGRVQQVHIYLYTLNNNFGSHWGRLNGFFVLGLKINIS